MTTRRRPLLLASLLALLLALSGVRAGGFEHPAAGGGAGLTAIVICGDSGPRVVFVDAEGTPVEQDGDQSCCDGLCIGCAGGTDGVGLLPQAVMPWPVRPAGAEAFARISDFDAHRRGTQRARAPPEGRT